MPWPLKPPVVPKLTQQNAAPTIAGTGYKPSRFMCQAVACELN